MNRQEVARLIDALIDGDITEADFLSLEAELSVDEALRREYFERIMLDMLLETESSGESSLPSTANRQPFFSWGSPWFPAIVASFSIAAAVLAMIVWTRGSRETSSMATNPSQVESTTSEEQASGYAVITGQDEVEWENGSVRATGSLLPTGDIRTAAGVVQIELFSGVSVVIEGPAEFSVTSPMHMIVSRGKVRAHVPEPAHGFRLSTRDGDVIDLGTDFAVDVTGDGSEVHVLEGEVELQSNGKSARRLESGEAVSMSKEGHTDLAADSDRFVGQDEIMGRLQLAMKSRRQRWLKGNERLCNDPRIVALYQVGMSDPVGRRIANRASSASGASEGAVVAATRTADRWQHRDGALDFSPTGSRIRLTVPGEYASLTLLCWVKINSLDRWYNSLFLTDGHDQREPHWQIMDDGRLFFSVKKRDQWDANKGEKDKHVYFSPPFWNTSLSGQWLMIATVYDIEGRQVTHFLNGNVLSTEQIPEEYLVERVRIGNASLCNWGLPERDEPRFAVRNLNGSLDEFVMFSAALSRDEIRELYKHGRP